MYEARKEYAKAIADYSEAIRLQPTDGTLWNSRCWARAISNTDLPAALTDCDRSLQLDAKNASTLDSRGFVYFRLNRFDEAIRDFDAAINIRPKLAASLYVRGLAKLRKGDKSGGEADIAAAKEIRKDIEEEYAGYGVKS